MCTVFLLLVLKLISTVREHTYAITHIRTCTEAHCKLAGVLCSACLKKKMQWHIKKKKEKQKQHRHEEEKEQKKVLGKKKEEEVMKNKKRKE